MFARDVVRTQTYSKSLKRLRKLGASDADILAMENEIAADPARGDVIQSSGGLRKFRFAFGGSGKRGGGRAIYFAWMTAETVILITTYPKVDKEDLSAKELKLFAALIEELTND
ncbi:MAG TPA: type II toxin-antitoxin system RelE/ParE family toxin [Caulobacteraceae bacterium]|nr:type II toxin-antitoxin system RelE/ParE family toxin [Caulobacteraceae bacterium]